VMWSRIIFFSKNLCPKKLAFIWFFSLLFHYMIFQRRQTRVFDITFRPRTDVLFLLRVNQFMFLQKWTIRTPIVTTRPFALQSLFSSMSKFGSHFIATFSPVFKCFPTNNRPKNPGKKRELTRSTSNEFSNYYIHISLCRKLFYFLSCIYLILLVHA
jgi:hypothetical protein